MFTLTFKQSALTVYHLEIHSHLGRYLGRVNPYVGCWVILTKHTYRWKQYPAHSTIHAGYICVLSSVKLKLCGTIRLRKLNQYYLADCQCYLPDILKFEIQFIGLFLLTASLYSINRTSFNLVSVTSFFFFSFKQEPLVHMIINRGDVSESPSERHCEFTVV